MDELLNELEKAYKKSLPKNSKKQLTDPLTSTKREILKSLSKLLISDARCSLIMDGVNGLLTLSGG